MTCVTNSNARWPSSMMLLGAGAAGRAGSVFVAGGTGDGLA